MTTVPSLCPKHWSLSIISKPHAADPPSALTATDWGWLYIPTSWLLTNPPFENNSETIALGVCVYTSLMSQFLDSYCVQISFFFLFWVLYSTLKLESWSCVQVLGLWKTKLSTLRGKKLTGNGKWRLEYTTDLLCTNLASKDSLKVSARKCLDGTFS